jgi:hypothetical protein
MEEFESAIVSYQGSRGSTKNKREPQVSGKVWTTARRTLVSRQGLIANAMRLHLYGFPDNFDNYLNLTAGKAIVSYRFAMMEMVCVGRDDVRKT